MSSNIDLIRPPTPPMQLPKDDETPPALPPVEVEVIVGLASDSPIYITLDCADQNSVGYLKQQIWKAAPPRRDLTLTMTDFELNARAGKLLRDEYAKVAWICRAIRLEPDKPLKITAVSVGASPWT